MRFSPQKVRGKAFTLLELSVVLVIIAVVIGSSMAMFSSSLHNHRSQETEAKLRTIQKALLDFRRTNNRLPCPADVILPLADPNFGVEGTTPGSCTDGGLATYTNDIRAGVPPGLPTPPTVDFANIFTVIGNVTSNEVTVSGVSPITGIVPGMAISGSGIPPGDSIVSASGSSIVLATPATASAAAITLTIGNNVEGMVPTKTLHLSDDDAVDSWGHRIMYTVDVRFTAADALKPYPIVPVVTGTVAANSASITNITTGGLGPRMFVYGSGIPSPNTVLNITSPTSMTLSSPAATDATPGSESLTFSATPIPATVILDADTTPRMTVNDQSGNPKTTPPSAAYVLVSFGPNGHGGYPRNGAALTSRDSSGSINPGEQNNCDCNSGAASNTIIPGGIFVQSQPYQAPGRPGNPTYFFDDIVVYGTRSDLRAPTE